MISRLKCEEPLRQTGRIIVPLTKTLFYFSPLYREDGPAKIEQKLHLSLNQSRSVSSRRMGHFHGTIPGIKNSQPKPGNNCEAKANDEEPQNPYPNARHSGVFFHVEAQ